VNRNDQTGDQAEYLEADLDPVPDGGGVSVANPAWRLEKPVQQIAAGEAVLGFSLDQAIPYFAPAIDAQIDCEDASDNLIKEKLHADIRSPGP
jgi:hypothetical protein